MKAKTLMILIDKPNKTVEIIDIDEFDVDNPISKKVFTDRNCVVYEEVCEEGDDGWTRAKKIDLGSDKTKPIAKMELPMEFKNLDEFKGLVKNLEEAIEALHRFEFEITISKPL